jgi:hypothetical protein
MSDPKKGQVLSLFGEDETLAPESLDPVGATNKELKRAQRARAREQSPKRASDKRSSAPPNHSTSQTAVLPGQGFLPGLSRRGRPRLPVPISPVERTAEHRRKRIEAGAKRVEIILDKDISGALDALAEHYKEPRSDVISTLIAKAANKVLKK